MKQIGATHPHMHVDVCLVSCSLVKQGHKEDEANVALVWFSGRLHIRVWRPIPAGAELLYWPKEAHDDPTEGEGRRLPSASDTIAVPEGEENPNGELAAAAVTETATPMVKTVVQREGASPAGKAAEPFSGMFLSQDTRFCSNFLLKRLWLQCC